MYLYYKACRYDKKGKNVSKRAEKNESSGNDRNTVHENETTKERTKTFSFKYVS